MLFVSLFAVGCTQYYKSGETYIPDESMVETVAPDVVMEDDSPVEAKDSMEVAVPAVKGLSNYLDYSEKTMKAELEAGQKVVLFFHAKWCPFCVKADKEFNKSPNEIPEGVTVLKLNYDTEKAMKEKYGVNYQHTFVQLNKEQNEVTKWVSGDIELLKKNIK